MFQVIQRETLNENNTRNHDNRKTPKSVLNSVKNVGYTHRKANIIYI